MKNKCQNCSGKIVYDVNLRGNTAHCRRCGAEVDFDGLDELTKNKIQENKEKENDKNKKRN